MVNKYCPVKYTFSVDDAADNDILNDYQIIVHELELSKVKNVKKTTKDGRTWYTSELSDYQYYTGALGDAQTPKQRQYLYIMRMRSLMDGSASDVSRQPGSCCARSAISAPQLTSTPSVT